MRTILSLVVSLTLFSVVNAQSNQSELSEKLVVFKPLLGKTFRGEFANHTPEKPMIDMSTWERAMNGKAIRILHSVNDGDYGGETIIMWDEKKQAIAYWYFTTAGFHTEGMMDVSGKEWSSVEEVTGNQNKITKVKSVSRLLDDGTLHVQSEYFAEGQWTKGHEIRYKEVEKGEVKFR